MTDLQWVLIIIAILSLVIIIGIFKNMKEGFGQNNIRIIVITIVCVFATFLALLKEQGITPAIGILGSVAGYIFGLKDNPKE